ncbi:MAG TPA: hypothetical protein H9830_10665 [Candidatus Agrococcus pullicola]|uniref:FtsK domain-containing protein n=1 Tax=Candidatus Agrococcus pullicola TaxID=2838429 RepID=A0A9D2CAB6_9MICO|nr:hypothetical protein [Candidatus Agrococcus pullicola]
MSSRLALPGPPQQPGPASFPIFASLAPVIGALVLFAFMQTPYVLLFAVLGPVIAVASMIDRRIGASKLRRREAARFEEEAELLRVRVRQQTNRAMDELRARRPDARELGQRDARHPNRWRWREGELPVVLGRGDCPTGLTLDEPPEPRGVVRELFDELAPVAAVGTGPVCVDARTGIGLYGPHLVAMGLARTAIVQVLDAVSPEQATVIVEGGEHLHWVRETPHNVRFTERDAVHCIVRVLSDRGDSTIAVAPEPDELPRECGLRILASAAEIEVAGVSTVPRCIGQHEAVAHLRRLRESAAASGFVTAGTLPEHVALETLPQSTSGGLAATFLAASEPVTVDLVADGPHAVVGGTTGSGKSELLVSWVTSLAIGYTSEELNVLLVDFKGGASFGELQRLRHCVGLMTDLDEAGAVRAIESLRAELRFREHTLAELGVRSIDETDALPRLVVVVDEFAAMLQELPDLHKLFVDIAARGRSLGVHLILCTQRPADAVRDALMTNCGLRLCLRVNDEPDSVAVVGAPDAAHFDLAHRGRCAVRISGSARIIAQTALAEEEHIRQTVQRSLAGPKPRHPYLPPLPESIAPESVTAVAEPGAVIFAYADRPAMQRRDAVRWHPRNGSVFIVGSSASGKSTAARRFCNAEGAILIDELEALWDAVDSPPDARVIVIDDLDMLLMQAGDEHAHEISRGLQQRMREAGARGVAFVLTARRVGGPLTAIAALVEHTVVMRMPTKQEHLLAGATAPHVPELPAGGGWLGDDRVQFVLPEGDPPSLAARYEPLPPGPLAVVAGRPEQLPADLRKGVEPGQQGELIVGTPAQWESAWGSLEAALSERPVALLDTADRQLRSLLRGAVQLPICSGPGRWLVANGRASRLRM